MNKEQWEKGMNNIDDGLLNEAISYKKKNNGRKMAIWASSVAAVAALGIGIGVMNSNKDQNQPSSEVIANSDSAVHTKDESSTLVVQDEISGEEGDKQADESVEEFEEVVNIKYLANASIYEYLGEAIRTSTFLDDADYNIFDKFVGSTATALYNDGDNFVYSPLSLYTALSMLQQCENETGSNDLAEVLGVDAENMSTYVKKIMDSCMVDTDFYKFLVSNSAWMIGDWFNEEGKNKISGLSNIYQADIVWLDDADDASSAVGNWIKDKTHGLIDKEIQLDGSSALTLVNTTYFNAKWKGNLYWSPAKLVFKNSDGSEKGTNAFAINSNFVYDSSDRYEMVQVPYSDSGYLAVFLPKKGILPGELLNQDVSEAIEKIRKNVAEKKNVDYIMPELELAVDLEDIKSVLGGLGVDEALSTKAFDGLVENEELEVSKITQNNKLLINIEGTTVASDTFVAVTGAGCVNPDEVVKFIVDRPFAYAICSANGVIEYIGVVNSIE